MILFNPNLNPNPNPKPKSKLKPKRPRHAAKTGSVSGHPSQRCAPPIRAPSSPYLPLRPIPSDPPPYSLLPPERTSPVTVASSTSTTQPRQNANASQVAVNPLPAIRDGPKQWQPKLPDAPHHRISLCDLISSKLDAVITSIDGEVFSGDERELGV